MKLSTVVVGVFLGPALCSKAILGKSRKALALSQSRKFEGLPTDPSGVNVIELATFGKDLDEFSLNEAMKRMGGGVGSSDKAHLLNENKKIMNKPYEELVDYAFGYGLTELLGSLLFRYDGWRSEFNRHVFAARLYKREVFLLEEWQGQDNLDWGINYLAIFQADNPALLSDMLFNPSNVFQTEEQLENWESYRDTAIKFIQKHLHRLIVYYDSARILAAISDPQSASPITSLSPNSWDNNVHDLVGGRSFENDNGDIHITRFNRKLSSMSFKQESLVSSPPHKLFEHSLTYDHIEYWVECGILASLDDDMASNIFEHDYDWGIEMLYQRNLLGTSISMRHVKKVISKGSHKILAWIYDHVHEWPQDLEREFESWTLSCPLKHLSGILRVHKSHFPQYRPSQPYVNTYSKNAETLDFFETFDPLLYPQKEIVDSWRDLKMVLRVYKTQPSWRVSKEVFQEVTSYHATDLVDYVLKDLPNEKVEYVCSLQLIQHNARVDESYVPSENELRRALHSDGAALASWLDKEDRFKGLFKKYPKVFSSVFESFQLTKWLWDNKKIKPSKRSLRRLFKKGDLNACEWAWKEFEEKTKQLDEGKLSLIKKEKIQWWIENVNKNYTPDICKAFMGCVRAGDIDSAKQLVESWPLYLDGKEVLPGIIWVYENETVLDFIELIYKDNVSIFHHEHPLDDYGSLFFPSNLFEMMEEEYKPFVGEYLWEMRCRPNLKRILMEHAHVSIPMDEWEFIVSLPGLYGIDSSIVKKMIERNDYEVLVLLHSRGLLHDLEESVKEEVEKVTKLVAEVSIDEKL